jgi:predicted secreted protein
MLLVLFAIVSIFLYNSVANGLQQIIPHVTADQLTELRKQVPVIFTLAEPGTALFTVHVRTTNPAGDDLAKQLIVLLGTLVTAVSSFYFGANTVASAVAKRDAVAPPKPSGISPTSLKRDGSPQDITITGDNLANVNDVKIRKDNVTIPAQIKGATATQVNCQIVIKSNQEEGNWDVFVGDGTNEVKLPVQVKIESPVDAAAADAPTSPNPTAIGQASLTRGGSPQALTITGENLAKVNAVKLVKDGAVIQAEFKSATPTKVDSTIVITNNQQEGEWDVIVSDGTSEVKLPNKVQVT